MKIITAHLLEAQWGCGRKIQCSEGWLWPSPSAQHLSQSRQEWAQALTETKFSFIPKIFLEVFQEWKQSSLKFVIWMLYLCSEVLKLINFFGQTMIISFDNLSG